MAGGASLAPRRWSWPASAMLGAQDVGVRVDRPDHGHEEGQELRVGVRIMARIEQVLPLVRAHRPVVVLARAVDPRERLLVGQEHQAVPRRKASHHAQHDHVVVGADRGGLVDRGHLELAGRHLVVAGLGRDAQAPQLPVQVHHEGEDALADRAEVLVLELLALGGRCAEQRAPGQDEVRALLGKAPVDQEVLLLGPDVREDPAGAGVVEPAQDAQGLRAQRLLRSQHRDLVIERLARERDEGGRDGERHAVRLDLQVDRARDVPGGVAAGLEGGPDAAGREGAGVGLALEQVPAGELGDGLAVARGAQERVVLLRGGAGHRHEPVGVVGGPMREGPLLHPVRDGVGDHRVEGLQALDRPAQALEDRLGQELPLGGLVEHVLAVDLLAGVGEVVLGRGNLVVRDRLDGRVAGGHVAPISTGGHVRGFGPESGRFQGSAA